MGSYHYPKTHANDLNLGSGPAFILALAMALGASFSLNPLYLWIQVLFLLLLNFAISRKLSPILKAFRYSMVLFAIVFILHLFYQPGRSIFKFLWLNATREGAVAGFIYGLKILAFGFSALLLTLSVRPAEIVLPLEKLARRFGARGAFLEKFALSMLLALRYLPEMAFQARQTSLSLRSRGYDQKGGLITKSKFAMLLFPPLLVNSLKRAHLTASAMSIKGYATRHLKAVLPHYKLAAVDFLVLVLSITSIILGLSWN